MGVAPEQFEAGLDGSVVGLEAAREGAQDADAAGSSRFQPSAEPSGGLDPDVRDGGRDSVVDVGELEILPTPRNAGSPQRVQVGVVLAHEPRQALRARQQPATGAG